MASLQKDNSEQETEIQQENLIVFSDFEDALVQLSADPGVAEIFVIGGSSLYEASMTTHMQYCKLVIATRINKLFECDTFTLNLENQEENQHFAPLSISETYSDKDVTFDFCVFGNTGLLAQRPELIPQKLMSKYPKHPEM